ncbi:hypothetical protein [Streptomyces sp. CBMA152]|uniref:hypothetical protein n=1 Tax=Streptomyces sp. CBMA152 TaxID=1896312 RepID=UPI0016616716|nr:hypothetical protein [Streptomyces sp. CBMA152]MBD0742990.1 hypothetical protein [Streptomyces sp. CBMA152]
MSARTTKPTTFSETPMTAFPAVPPVGGCVHVRHIQAIETPFITELVAALHHLTNAAALAVTPNALVLPNGNTVTAQQMSIWVAANTSSLLVQLDAVTARYPDQHAAPAPRS